MGCFFLFAPSDALGNQDMLGVGEAEGGSEAFGVVGSADDIVQPHGGAEQAHVLVGGTRMHGREKLFAVFLGVGDVNQPYRGFADKALPGEEVAQVGGADLFEAVFRGVVEPCSVAAEDVDFKILPVLGRGDGPFSVGAVHAVRGPEQIAEQFVGKRLGGERAVCRPSAERLHERLSPLGIGRGECKGGGGLRRAHHEEETGGQYRNEPFRHSVGSLEKRRASEGWPPFGGRMRVIMGWLQTGNTRSLP